MSPSFRKKCNCGKEFAVFLPTWCLSCSCPGLGPTSDILRILKSILRYRTCFMRSHSKLTSLCSAFSSFFFCNFYHNDRKVLHLIFAPFLFPIIAQHAPKSMTFYKWTFGIVFTVISLGAIIIIPSALVM